MGKDYEILGLSEGAEQKEIKKAYFKLVRQFSPEKDPEKFQEIRGAYERLMQGDNQEKEEFRLSMKMPDDPFAHRMFQQMVTLGQQGDYDGAAATAQEAIGYFGEYEAFLYELAENQLYSGHSGNAVKNFEKLVKRYPEKTVYKQELAIAYFDRGYGKKAFQAFEDAYAAGVRDTDFVLQFSLCCRDREEKDRGIEILLEMVKGYDAAAKESVQDYLEAYTGLFSLNSFAPSDAYGEILDLYCDFLKTERRLLKDYGDLVANQTLFVVKTFRRREYMDKLGAIVAAVEKILPERLYSKERKQISELLLETRIRLDKRLDGLWDECFQAYFVANHLYDEESIIRFVQMDSTLLLLERRDELKPQFEIVRTEYPELCEKMKDVYAALEQDNVSYLMDKMRKSYSLLSRSINGGRYYKLYPQYKEKGEGVQWDSFENGSYVRMGRKIGRNDPCPCGSGKKYKKCCGK